MKYTLDEKVSSFRVTAFRHSDELKADAYTFRHDKTGCEILWLDNGEENKVFSIAFRTLPEDDTGVFHILEHSVLCGSEKYPVREPFVELLKSSMNTFLNAMTFPDMTMYPVSSRNPRDLLNLTEVYLDAVFRPRILTDERIFCQEGWHIENDESGSPVYKGVVFNEMKGAMSDVDTLSEHCLMRAMFPDNAYGFNSGGDPEAIPTLTREEFLRQYRRHYHPSNARIVLDGDVPMAEMLSLIASYLDTYEPLKDIPFTPMQASVVTESSCEYELSPDEEPENRSHLLLGRIVGTWEDKPRNMAWSLIGDVLTGSNDAPLKRLILEKELTQEFSLNIDDTARQACLILHAENVTDGKEEELLRTVSAFGVALAEKGLDHAALEASLNRMIFALKEDEEPRGIGRAIHASGVWLYGGDPIAELEYDDTLKAVREMIVSGELDRMASDMLSDLGGFCTVHMLPSHTLGDDKRREEEARLRDTVGNWSEADRLANDSLVASLQTWQSEPDSPEALATLPMLKKEDADIPPQWTETEVLSPEGVTLLQHLIPCGGLVHARMLFSLTDITADELSGINLLTCLLGKLPTAHHDALSLQLEIKRLFGRLSFSVSTRPHPTDPSLCSVVLLISAGLLPENTESAMVLLSEILWETDFSDTGRIMELFTQMDLALRQRITGAGHSIAIRNVLSHYSAEGVIRNLLDGDVAITSLRTVLKDPEKELITLRSLANRLREQTFCKARLLLSLTADKPIDWSPLLDRIPLGTPVPEYASYTLDTPIRRGYRIPARIGYAVRGYHLSRCGASFDGMLKLSSNILSLGYLWNKVRVQGGAYGAGINVDRHGNLFTFSYRDPTPARTLTVDAGLSAFLREFAESGEPLDKYIISTLNDLNPLLGPREKGAVADTRWLSGYTMEQAETLRKQILHATTDDLVRCVTILDTFAADGAVCVVGYPDAVEACPDLEISDL